MAGPVTVDVRVFATLRLKSGRGRAAWHGADATTVRDVVRWLDGELGFDVWNDLIDGDGAIRPGTMLLVDGHNVHHLDGLDTPMQGGRLDVFPPAGGG